MDLSYVGSVKLEEHKKLAQISNNDERFHFCDEHGDGNGDGDGDELEGTKSFRVKKLVSGNERVLIVTYNQNLFNNH